MAISSFKPGSAGGQNGLNPKHLKDITAEAIGEPAIKLVDMLVEFFNKIVLCGKVPEEVCRIFYGANLTALSKPDGGVRPIAVGFTLRRLASKILSYKLLGKSESLFQPNQVGVGTPKGAEAAVHAVRAYIKSPTSKSKVLLKIDFKRCLQLIEIFFARTLTVKIIATGIWR